MKRVEFNQLTRFMLAQNPEWAAAYADCQKTSFTDLTYCEEVQS